MNSVKIMHKKIYLFLILIIIIFIGINFLQDKQIRSTNVEDISEQIILPVKAHIIVDSSGVYTSSRNEENIISLLEESNRIWNQANIYFQLEEIVVTNVDVWTISNVINGNNFEISAHKNFADNKINLFLAQNLNDINGLALGNINSIFVADYTTVNDFRTTAHELGHILSLNHVEPINRLMARGKNGEILLSEEVFIARNNAVNLF